MTRVLCYGIGIESRNHRVEREILQEYLAIAEEFNGELYYSVRGLPSSISALEAIKDFMLCTSDCTCVLLADIVSIKNLTQDVINNNNLIIEGEYAVIHLKNVRKSIAKLHPEEFMTNENKLASVLTQGFSGRVYTKVEAYYKKILSADYSREDLVKYAFQGLKVNFFKEYRSDINDVACYSLLVRSKENVINNYKSIGGCGIDCFKYKEDKICLTSLLDISIVYLNSLQGYRWEPRFEELESMLSSMYSLGKGSSQESNVPLEETRW